MATEKMALKSLADWGLFCIICIIYLALAFPVKWAWNYTMPYIFNLPTINWGHAWCIIFLSHVIFKNSSKEK
jgi:hypothetical protein